MWIPWNRRLSTSEGRQEYPDRHGEQGTEPLYAIEGYEKRCFARVLSTGEAVEESIRLGFRGRHLIAMQGPFSAEMNLALLHQTEARYFVTKESGKAGGFGEKLEAAKAAGAVLVAVARTAGRRRKP